MGEGDPVTAQADDDAWEARANWWARHLDFFEVTEATRRAGRVIRLRHCATGITVETRRGASLQDAYLDAFIEMTEALDVAGIYPPGMAPKDA